MKSKFASAIYVIRHPLLTLSIFAIIALFTYEEFQKAFLHSAFIKAEIILPLTLKMYLRSKSGAYINYYLKC